MKSTRRLVLRSEALAELGADQLGAVAGGQTDPTCLGCPSRPLTRCVTDALNCVIYDPDSLVCSRYVC